MTALGDPPAPPFDLPADLSAYLQPHSRLIREPALCFRQLTDYFESSAGLLPHVPYMPPREQLLMYDPEPYEGIVDFNRAFFANGDSRDPEQAGVRGALFGSFLGMIVGIFARMRCAKISRCRGE